MVVWVEKGGKVYRVRAGAVEVVFTTWVGKGFGRWERTVWRTVKAGGPTATKVLAAAKEKAK